MRACTLGALHAPSPQRAQVRFCRSAKKRSNTAGNCFSMSVSAKNSSYRRSPQRSQYHWKPSSSPARRARSMTSPTVLAGRCGECGSPGGMQQHLPGADRHIHRAPVLHGLEHHVALELVEELLARIDVVVLAGVRAAHDHDDEVAVAEHALVAHRRLEQRAVGARSIRRKLKACRDSMSPPCLSRMLRAAALGGRRCWMLSRSAGSARAARRGTGAPRACCSPAAATCTGPGTTRRRPPPAPVHEVDIAGAGLDSVPQYWKRNTLLLDMSTAQRFAAASRSSRSRARPGRCASPCA